jgi:acylglycerol lipase
MAMAIGSHGLPAFTCRTGNRAGIVVALSFQRRNPTMTEATTTEFFESADGTRLFLRSWLPEGAPRGVVALCHGFNAHSGQYGWVAEQLVEQGYAVYAPDLRGRGESEGERFYVEDVADYVSDLSKAIAIAKSRHPGLPVFLLGHSAGGVVSCTYVLDNQAELAGFICEDFAFQIPRRASRWPRSRAEPHRAASGRAQAQERGFLARSGSGRPAQRRSADYDETQPAATVAALVRADERLHDSFPQITIPLLILHGTGDKATVFHGQRVLPPDRRLGDKTLKLYEGHYHDLLNDIGKEERDG